MHTKTRLGAIRILHRMLFLLLLMSFSAFLCDTARAQSSREDEIAQQQAEKAKTLKVYTPSTAERILMRAQNFLQAPQNFYPLIPSTYPSGGFALGAGYRRRYGDTGWFDVHGGYSILNY